MKPKHRPLRTLALSTVALVALLGTTTLVASLDARTPGEASPPAIAPSASSNEGGTLDAYPELQDTVTPLHFFEDSTMAAEGSCKICIPVGVWVFCRSDPDAYCARCIQNCMPGSGMCEISGSTCKCVCDNGMLITNLT